jgi:hypothetical protein
MYIIECYYLSIEFDNLSSFFLLIKILLLLLLKQTLDLNLMSYQK